MQLIQQDVSVVFRYPVCFTTDLFAPDNTLLSETVREAGFGPRKKVLFIVDSSVATHHPDLLTSIVDYCEAHNPVMVLAGHPVVVEGGEGVKNSPDAIELVHGAINQHGIDRHSYVVALGGGAVIDMVGYAAATAHRGVRLIRVPTTVLSQNDSAVGVKNSVNAYGKKNFLGTFAPPYAVLNDTRFLTTLSYRDWMSGVSEAIKVALLKDPAFFEYMEEHAAALVSRDMPSMEHVIYRCAELHLQHIATSGDAFEMGSSRPLDFGHWSAHKLEQLSEYRLRHGEAVAIGIALDSTYSFLQGMLPEEDWHRILRLIHNLGLPLYSPELDEHLAQPTNPMCVLAGLQEFREHLGGRLTIMLLEAIGRGVEVHHMATDALIDSIDVLQNYAAAQAYGGSACPPPLALAR